MSQSTTVINILSDRFFSSHCLMSGKQPSGVTGTSAKMNQRQRGPSRYRYPRSAVLVFRPLLTDSEAKVNKLFNVDGHFSTWHFFQRARLKQFTTLISTYLPLSLPCSELSAFLSDSHHILTQP